MLGGHIRTLQLYSFLFLPFVSQGHEDALLTALPFLSFPLVGHYSAAQASHLSELAAVCQSAGRHLVLQLNKEFMSEGQATAWSSEWLRVVRV